MAKNSIPEYSAVAASNTDCGGVDSQGTAPASNMDDLIRELMSHLKEASAGTNPVEDTWTFADPADLTKRVRLDAGNVTAGQTRVITVPDANITLPNSFATLTSLEGLTLGAGDMLYATAADTLADLAIGTAGQFLVTNAGATAPEWASRPTLVSLEGLTLNAGDIVYATAADTLADLAIGTAGQSLIVNAGATAPSWGSSIVSGTVQASTSGTAIDFTSIPSWVKRVTVLFDGVSLSGTDQLLVQIGDSGGIEATGYVSVGGQTFTSGGGEFNSTSGFIIGNNVAAGEQSGSMVIAQISTNKWVSSHALGSDGGTELGLHGGGVKTLSGTLDRVRVTRTGTNTFDAGSINILYE